jgi:hypothetical protein
MFTNPYHSPHTSALRASHVLKTLGDCRGFAAHRLAAEERQQAAIAAAYRHDLLRQSGVRSIGIAASLRLTVGSALIRVGQRLRGQATPRVATNPNVSAG